MSEGDRRWLVWASLIYLGKVATFLYYFHIQEFPNTLGDPWAFHSRSSSRRSRAIVLLSTLWFDVFCIFCVMFHPLCEALPTSFGPPRDLVPWGRRSRAAGSPAGARTGSRRRSTWGTVGTAGSTEQSSLDRRPPIAVYCLLATLLLAYD